MPSSASAGGCGTLGWRRPGRESSASVGWSSGPTASAAQRRLQSASGRFDGAHCCRPRRQGADAKRSMSASVVTSVAHTQQRVAQRRRRPGTSRPAADRPGRHARAGAAWTAGASGTRTANSLRYGAAWTRGAPAAASAVSSLRGLARAESGDVAQTVRPERGDVDGCRQRAQRLVGADVAGGLVAPDVLLARTQRHDVGACARRGRWSGRPAGPGTWRTRSVRAASRPR